MTDLEYYFAQNDPALVIADEAPKGSVRLAIMEGIGEATRIIAISSPCDPNTPFMEMFKERNYDHRKLQS